MENKTIFKDTVSKSSEIRYELNVDWQRKMNILASAFCYIAQENRQVFTALKDMIYYDGGYPKATSLPKLHIFLNRFAKVFKWYVFIGRGDEVIEHLRKQGICASLASSIQDSDINFDEIRLQKFWRKLEIICKGSKIPTTKKEFLNFILDEAFVIQGIICKKADIIKITNYAIVEENCHVKKPTYSKSVVLAYKKMRKSNIDREVEQVKQEAKELDEATEIVREK